jgi:hypothetical protein
MFKLAFERRPNILLARFSGASSSQDISERDLAAIQFTAVLRIALYISATWIASEC